MNQSRKTRWLRYAAVASVAIWMIGQIVMVICFWDRPQVSDANNYATFAREAVEAGCWYPTVHIFTTDMWVANTGYINFLVANLRIFGTLTFVGIEQIGLNILLLWSLWKLAGKFGGKDAALATVTVFCLLPSNAMHVPTWMSDLMFCSLMLWSCTLMRRSVWWLLLAGAVMSVANWVRPTALVFIPSLILYGLYVKAPVKDWISYATGAAIVTCAVTALVYSSCGYPLSGSTTKGTNMMMGCWDGADGGYDASVFSEGNPGYISPELHYNVLQTDSCLTHRSVEWIMDNPVRFLTLAPVKMGRLWGADCYADKMLVPKDRQLSTPMRTVWSVTYYVALLLVPVGLWKMRKRLWGLAGILFLPVIAGSGMHLLMYGGLRYHYPMMPSVIFFAAIGLCALLRMQVTMPTRTELLEKSS